MPTLGVPTLGLLVTYFIGFLSLSPSFLSITALVENGGLWWTWIMVDVDYGRRGLWWTWSRELT